MVAPASHDYPVADLRGAAAFAIPAAVVLARTVGPLVWAGPHDLWIFLGIFFPLFFLCRLVVMRLPRLKRLFVSEKEMDHEVREAATIQFFLKGLFRTREETGVLIYLSVFEGNVWVLGDRGVDAAVPPGFWQGVVDEVVAGVKEWPSGGCHLRCGRQNPRGACGKVPGGRKRHERTAEPDCRRIVTAINHGKGWKQEQQDQ